MRLLLRTVAAGALLAAPLAPLAAQAPAAAAPAAAAGIRQDLVAQLEDAEKKLIALAEATPQDKYGWRPAAGVRSTSEVFMHMAGANYMIPPIAGAARAAGLTLTPDSEKTVTDKAAVVKHLRESFAYAKQAVLGVADDQLSAPVTLFGRPSTKRGVLVLMATHAHEHLGQSIAYARTNGIVPPWSGAGGGND
ncbi:DinB family protein [Roseisolibacter sp. H3M3-2]|uniref:DinB family protein n=1 Tax=Roseisolibacter sp. H3M3-2 TaxID=3031323 RepID=UPI0023DB8EE3|nr:DinB family protein [Roseisolibacter sp. H3M3-2]MDF1502531.1 DinB family protein [Roseisolibacter sp. H3M3-2]